MIDGTAYRIFSKAELAATIGNAEAAEITARIVENTPRLDEVRPVVAQLRQYVADPSLTRATPEQIAKELSQYGLLPVR